MNKIIARYALETVRHLKWREEHRDWQWRTYGHAERDGYCRHGVYVGGCGVDWMCHVCEMGYSDYEYALGEAYRRFRRERKAAHDKVMVAMFAANDGVERELFTDDEWKAHWRGLLTSVRALAPERH